MSGVCRASTQGVSIDDPSRVAKEAPAPVSALILAGGKSSRFGVDKALLPVAGQPLVALMVSRLSSLSDDLVVVTNDVESLAGYDLPARLVPDVRPGLGPLMGIYSGLLAARYSHALAVACDMPLLSLPLLEHMVGLVTGYDVVLPCLDGELEPLHAIYDKSCLPAMAHALDRGERRIVAFFPEVRVRCVSQEVLDRFDPGRLSLLNVNTPEDWERVQRLLTDRT